MCYTEALWQWEQTVSRHLPHLSRPQVVVLALWSYAMIVCKSCGTTSAAQWLGELLGDKYEAWRQRLREWCYDARDKKGAHRSEVVVVSCFASLLRWMVTWWAPGEHRIALAASCQHALRSLYRALYQCALSRLCHSRGMVHRAHRRTRGLEARLDRLVELFGWSDPR